MALKYNIGFKKQYRLYVNPEAGVINGSSTVTGTLSSKGALSGEINGTSILSGSFSDSASSNGSSIVTGTLIPKNYIYGISEAESYIEGLLTAKANLTGTINGSATVSANLFLSGLIYDIIDGVATVTGVLTGRGQLEGASFPNPLYFDLSTGTETSRFFADNESYGQTIIPVNQAVQYAEFFVRKVGAPDFDITAQIWTLDINGLPDTLVQTSVNVIAASSLTVGVLQYVRFNFNTAGISYDEKIAVVINISNHVVGDLSNYIERYYDVNNLVPDINAVYNFDGLTWVNNFEHDINSYFQLVSGGGTLTGHITGITNASASVSGTLNSQGGLVGIINTFSTVIGEMLGLIPLGTAQSDGVATVTGTLTFKGGLSGVINSTSNTQLLLGVLNGSLNSVINGNSTAWGTLTVQWSGTSNGIATVKGTLLATGPTPGSIFGTVRAYSVVIGRLNGRIPIEGETNGVSTVTGVLTFQGGLIGVINGTSVEGATLIGLFDGFIDAIGIINGVATVKGRLTDKNQVEQCCFYEVEYEEEPCYEVEYVEEKYYVNYNC